MTVAASHQGLDKGNTNIHTIGMKIAISIPDNIFREVKKLAEEQKRSRSEVIVEAVRQYLKDLETRRMIDSLNEVYSTPETEEERAVRAADLEIYARTVLAKEEDEW
ncbi:MAG: ribbon-helix-helix protein, CopG family [Candidatus Aminicenantes bacterium]|nr:ribbon-helix-helix protein, CopG family [Candidatus Aminicenantes bacterium]